MCLLGGALVVALSGCSSDGSQGNAGSSGGFVGTAGTPTSSGGMTSTAGSSGAATSPGNGSGGSGNATGQNNTGGTSNGAGGTSAAGSGGAATGGTSNGGAPNGGTANAGAPNGGTANGGTSGAAGSASTGGGAGQRPFKGVANSPCAARKALNVSWYYNWEQGETEACSDGRGGEFVPMIWGHTGDEQSAPKIQSTVSSFVSKGYHYVLGFNEPDNSTQSNISVTTAISLLPAFDDPSISVGTAATQANSTGQTWFKDYMGQVNASKTLRADFIAIHWYGWNSGSCDAKASQLESYIKYAEGFAGNRPIWLTEWGCLNQSAPTADGVAAFYQGALAVFAKHPRVERYAWYPWSTNCELDNDDGSLTALGTAYAAAAAYH
ncbi:MAG TPA: glycosyl hydrolase [Polyangiaceae bacterium]|nr:glycosyl hydrolase [Polyangiaceae bacterium]